MPTLVSYFQVRFTNEPENKSFRMRRKLIDKNYCLNFRADCKDTTREKIQKIYDQYENNFE